MAVTVRENDFYIGSSTRNSAAVFQIDSTTGGALFPRMSTTQRDAISSPPTGLSIFNTTTNQNETYNGTSWEGPGSGDVTGAASSTDNAVARFNGTGGKTIQNSGVMIDDNNEITGALSLTLSDSATTPPLNITERSAAPSAPATHDLYLDDGTNTAHGNPGFRRYNGSAFEDIGPPVAAFTSYAILAHKETQGTGGGNLTATSWVTNGVTHELADPDNIVSGIASGAWDLGAGTYRLRAKASLYANAVDADSALRLYNVSDTAVIDDDGQNGFMQGNRGASSLHLEVRFTLAATKTVRIEQYSSANVTNGMGKALNVSGRDEVYMIVGIEKE